MEGRAPRLLERRAETARLTELIGLAHRGRGSVCVIEGPSGIGKTALLEACRDVATRLKAQVLAARAGVLERELSWSVVRQMFARVIAMSAGESATLLAGAAALAAPALGLELSDETGALHGLYWLTSNLTGDGPLLLALDDAQWADDASLGFLAYLAQRISDLPILMVLTIRQGEEMPAALRSVVMDPGTESISLEPLSPAAATEMTRSALGSGAADEFCTACHGATGGNPFLLHALLDAVGRDGIEPTADGAPEVKTATAEVVARSVLLRLTRIPNGSDVTKALAVLGGEAELAEVAALSDLGQDSTGIAADALVAFDILTPGPRLAFAHAIVREAVYREIPLHQRAGLHAGAARVLASAGAPAGRVAAHLLECEPLSDPEMVAPLTEAAAEALASGAPSSAAALLERALREPVAGDERAELLALLGKAEVAAGRATAPERLRESVEVSADPVRRAQVLLGLGRSLYIAGRPREAAKALERGLGELTEGALDQPSLVAEIQAAWLTVGRTEIPLRDRAAKLAHEIAQDPPPGHTHGERALLSQVAGELTFEAAPRSRALELARLALAEGKLIDEETSDGINWWAALGALGWGDDFDGYEAAHQHLIDDARRRGSGIGFAAASYGLSFSHFYAGLLQDAVADAEQALAFERHGWAQFLPAARAHLAWALIDRGQLDAAVATLDAAGDRESTEYGLVWEARARLELARGNAPAALEAALAAGRALQAGLIPNPSVAPWRSRAAVAAAQLGDTERAEALLDEELRLARRFGAPRPIGVALMAAALVRRGGAELEALDEAVAVLCDSPARLEHARAQVLYGAALRRRGRLQAAREILRLGLDLATNLGASRIENRARSELAAAGARPRRPRLSGVESLTPAEMRVAGLAAEGMSNREIAESLFVSLRTVETHLTHAYRKLDIESRSRLAEALDAEQAVAPGR